MSDRYLINFNACCIKLNLKAWTKLSAILYLYLLFLFFPLSLGHIWWFSWQVGEDANAELLRSALTEANVDLQFLRTVKGPSGSAVILLQPSGRRFGSMDNDSSTTKSSCAQNDWASACFGALLCFLFSRNYCLLPWRYLGQEDALKLNWHLPKPENKSDCLGSSLRWISPCLLHCISH